MNQSWIYIYIFLFYSKGDSLQTFCPITEYMVKLTALQRIKRVSQWIFVTIQAVPPLVSFKQILEADSPRVPNPPLSEPRPLLNSRAFTACCLLPDHFTVIIISASQSEHNNPQQHEDRVGIKKGGRLGAVWGTLEIHRGNSVSRELRETAAARKKLSSATSQHRERTTWT